MKEEYSKVRNRTVANSFSYRKIIEEWGSIFQICWKSLKTKIPPVLIGFDGYCRGGIYCKKTYSTNQELKNNDIKDAIINIVSKECKIPEAPNL